MHRHGRRGAPHLARRTVAPVRSGDYPRAAVAHTRDAWMRRSRPLRVHRRTASAQVSDVPFPCVCGCACARPLRRTTLLTSFTTGMRRTVFVQVTVETASCAFHARREPGPAHGDAPNVLASVFPARPLPFAFGMHRGVVKRTRPQAVSCMPRLTWMRRDQAPPASTARCSHHLDRSTRGRQVRRCAEHRRGVPVRVSLP